MTAVVTGLIAHYTAGLAGPASIVIGNGLALSSTAVVLQVNIIRFFSSLLRTLGIIILSFFLVLHLNVLLLGLHIFPYFS